MTIESIREAFELSKEQFEQIVKGFKNEYEQGLNTAEAKGLATMIPSYVTKLPTGQEQGTFLALDLGGSTLRVCAVELLGNGKVNVKEMKRSIPMTDPLRQGHVDPFFDWIAETVELLLKEYHIDHKNTTLSMGVSWSFPIDQTSVSDGTILRMGKGFDLKGIIGKDLKSLFTDAFKRKKINVKVSALVNDTVGVLVAHAYSNPKSRIGFIYGTGTNAAYPEKISKMVKLKATNHYHQDEEMLVNTEIDIFGSESYLPLNRFDLHLDQHHNQPKFQLYEKMMSGGYLGELVRLAALELINEKVLFHGCTPLEFKEMYLFDSSKLSDIESQANQPLNVKSSYIQSLFTFDTNYSLAEQDVEIIIELCLLVATRGAKLAGAAIASLIEQQAHLLLIKDDQQPIVIGVNGSTYELYPQMPSRILNSLSDWFGTEIANRIQLEVARDGASIGSALIAMLYTEDQLKNDEQVSGNTIQHSIDLHSQKSMNDHTINNEPPLPPIFSCLFGWLTPLKQWLQPKSASTSSTTVTKNTKINEK